MRRVILVLGIIFIVSLAFSSPVKLTLSGWPGNPDEEAAITAGVEAFNAKHSDIQLIWEPIPGDYFSTLKTRLSGGTGPDIFYVDVFVFEELATSNSMLSLDTYIKKDGFKLSDYYNSLVEAFQYKNRTYGIAKDFSTLALYFNKSIFDKCGVAYPTNDETWDSLLIKLQELKKKGVEYPIIVNPELTRMIPFINSFGGSVVDSNMKVSLSQPNSKKGFQFYIDLVTKYKVGYEASAAGAGWEGEAFGKENAAVMMSGPWCLGFLKGSYPNVYNKMGIVEMPKNVKRSTMVYTVCWAINRQSSNKDAAWEAMKFLVTEGQQIFVEKAGVLGSNKNVAAKDTDPIKQVFYKGADYATPWKIPTPTGLFSKANDQINSRIKDLFYNKITLDEALKQINENYDSWIK